MNKEEITIEKFGKDHWSLFAYIETRTVDYNGILDKSHLRIKNDVVRNSTPYPINVYWKPEYGTKLKGYFDKKDKKLQLPNHDDLDCFDDLKKAGLIKNMGTGFNPVLNHPAELTKFGISVASKLRNHKANGGYFSNFNHLLK